MTVLAIFHDLGLAFADVMLSTDEPGGHLTMPSTGNTRHLNVELPLSPSRLVRKFFRVSHRGKNGVFLVAGTVEHIKRLASNIKKVKDQSHLLSAEYRKRLCLSDVHNIMHLACLITEQEGYVEFEIAGVIDDATFTRLYDENRALDSAPYFGTTRLAGSGAVDLHRWICVRGSQYAERALAHEPLETKIARTINLVPSLLLEEDTRDTLSTISKGVWDSPIFTDTFIKLVKIEGNVKDGSNGIKKEIQSGVQIRGSQAGDTSRRGHQFGGQRPWYQ